MTDISAEDGNRDVTVYRSDGRIERHRDVTPEHARDLELQLGEPGIDTITSTPARAVPAAAATPELVDVLDDEIGLSLDAGGRVALLAYVDVTDGGERIALIVEDVETGTTEVVLDPPALAGVHRWLTVALLLAGGIEAPLTYTLTEDDLAGGHEVLLIASDQDDEQLPAALHINTIDMLGHDSRVDLSLAEARQLYVGLTAMTLITDALH